MKGRAGATAALETSSEAVTETQGRQTGRRMAAPARPCVKRSGVSWDAVAHCQQPRWRARGDGEGLAGHSSTAADGPEARFKASNKAGSRLSSCAAIAGAVAQIKKTDSRRQILFARIHINSTLLAWGRQSPSPTMIPYEPRGYSFRPAIVPYSQCFLQRSYQVLFAVS